MTLPTAAVVGSSGSFSFHIWEGQIRPKQYVADFYNRLGQIGTGVQLVGSMGAQSPVRATYLAVSDYDAATFSANVSLLKGTYANVVEPSGASWTGALFRESTPTRRSGVYPFAGSTFRFCVIVDLVIEAQ
jgi:hypothetical protein